MLRRIARKIGVVNCVPQTRRLGFCKNVPHVKSLVESSSFFLATINLPIYKNDRFLLSLKNKHIGQRCILLGSGPSVRLGDLDKIAEHPNLVTFCCNRFYLSYSQHRLRPSYTVSADRQMFEDHKVDIEEFSSGLVFFGNPNRQHFSKAIWVPANWGEKFVFSSQPFPSVVVGGGSLIFALQLGYFMGIREFFLYGVDHSFSSPVALPGEKVAGDGNHFINDYRAGKTWYPPWTDIIEHSFLECDKRLRLQGGFVKNATHGGKLEVLQRVSFRSIF